MTTGNVVEIRVGAKTKEAEQGMDRVKAKTKSLGGVTDKMSMGFRGLTKAMGVLGLGSIGTVISLSVLSNAAKEVASSAAATGLILSQLGPEFGKNFTKLLPAFKDAGNEFGFTTSAVGKAFGIMARESRNSNLKIDDLRFAMGLARTFSLDLATASNIVGQAILGNIKPLQDLTGELGSYNEIQEATIESGKEATTNYQIVSGVMKEWIHIAAGVADEFIGIGFVIKDLAPVVGKMLGRAFTDLFWGIFGSFKTFGTELGKAFWTIINAPARAFGWLRGFIGRGITGMLDNMKAGFATFGTWVGDFFTKTIPSAFSSTINFLTTIPEFVTGMFGTAGKITNQAMDATLNFKTGSVKGLAGMIWDTAGALGDVKKRTAEATINFTTGTLGGLVGQMWTSVGNLTADGLRAVSNKINFGTGTLSTIVGKMFNATTGLPIGQTIGAAFSWTAGQFTNVVVKKFFGATGAPTDQSISTVFAWVGGAFDNDTVKKFFKTTGSTIEQFIDTSFSWMSGGFFGTVAKFFSATGSVIKQWIDVDLSFIGDLSKIPGFIADVVKQIVDKVKAGIEGIVGLFGISSADVPVASSSAPSSAPSSMGIVASPSSRGGRGGVTVNMNFAGSLVVDDEMRERSVVRALLPLVVEEIRRGNALDSAYN